MRLQLAELIVEASRLLAEGAEEDPNGVKEVTILPDYQPPGETPTVAVRVRSWPVFTALVAFAASQFGKGREWGNFGTLVGDIIQLRSEADGAGVVIY